MSLISNDPVYYLQKILSQIATGQGGAILSVTGDLVDNTDPINPVVSLSPEDRAILDGLPKAHIILESTVAQAISTDQANPTVLDNWVVRSSSGMSLQGDSIRNDTGRVIESMTGTIGLHPQVDGGGGSRLLSLTSEYSVDDGLNYTINNQNRPIFTVNNSETYNTKESYATNLAAGSLIRFIAHSDAAISIAPSSTSFRNIVTSGPAALWILVEN